MIELKRTSRDTWWLILPVIAIFTIALTNISLAAYKLVPEVGTVYSTATWLAPLISIALWLVMIRYVYRLILPVQLITQISDDDVVFCDSRRPHDAIVLRKSDIRRFFVKPSRWWHTDGNLPVLCESNDGKPSKIPMNFVYDDTAAEFFDAIERKWGPAYVPEPAKLGWLSTDIRLWPKQNPKTGEPCDEPKSRSRLF